MKEIIDVQIGQVRADKGNVMLQSKAIGSCVAVVTYDAAKNAGAMAHIMLPGSAPPDKSPAEKNKYAADAIYALLENMEHLGSLPQDLALILVGGANVLKRDDDTICSDNIESILRLLDEKSLKVTAQALGGIDRRSVFLDIEQGTVFYCEGDGSMQQLYSAYKKAD